MRSSTDLNDGWVGLSTPSSGALGDVLESLGNRVMQVLGPAWYGYVDRASLVDDDAAAVRPLGPADAGLVEALRTQVIAAEWDEAGMNTGADFGIVVDGVLRAAANLGAWRGMPSIGVLTSPAFRRTGARPSSRLCGVPPGAERRTARPVPRLVDERRLHRGGRARRV